MLVRTNDGIWTEADFLFEAARGYKIPSLGNEGKWESVSASCALLATAKIIPAISGFYTLTLFGDPGSKEFFKKTIIAWALEHIWSTPITINGPEMLCDGIVDPGGFVTVPHPEEWFESVDAWLKAKNERPPS